MKEREGFALVLVLCIASVLSILLLQAYRRSSLLVRTVVEREQTLKLHNSLDALMQYALYMAKHNWDYLIKQTRKGAVSEHYFDWEVEPEKKGAATCLYKTAGESRLSVEVMLQQNSQAQLKIRCEAIFLEGKLIIESWKESS